MPKTIKLSDSNYRDPSTITTRKYDGSSSAAIVEHAHEIENPIWDCGWFGYTSYMGSATAQVAVGKQGEMPITFAAPFTEPPAVFTQFYNGTSAIQTYRGQGHSYTQAKDITKTGFTLVYNCAGQNDATAAAPEFAWFAVGK